MPAWTILYSESGVLPMPEFTKGPSFQTLETFQTMYITKQILDIEFEYLLIFKSSVSYLQVNASMDKIVL